MDYSDFVRGCHLGVFPSYYEPWGYTPGNEVDIWELKQIFKRFNDARQPEVHFLRLLTR